MLGKMTDLRRVIYPVQSGGDIQNRTGLFEVRYSADGSPVSAKPARLTGYVRQSEVERLGWLVSQAMMLDPLYCLCTVVTDEARWDGTLFFR